MAITSKNNNTCTYALDKLVVDADATVEAVVSPQKVA